MKYFDKRRSSHTFELYKKAKVLFQRYGDHRTFESALEGSFPDLEKTVPKGNDWIPPSQEPSLVKLTKTKPNAEHKKSGRFREGRTYENEIGEGNAEG